MERTFSTIKEPDVSSWKSTANGGWQIHPPEAKENKMFKKLLAIGLCGFVTLPVFAGDVVLFNPVGSAYSGGATCQVTVTPGSLATLKVDRVQATYITSSSTLSMGGALSITDATASSSKDTGSIITDGGVGVEKSVYVGDDVVTTDDIIVGDDLTANGKLVVGETASITGTVTAASNIVVNGSNASTDKDTGAIVTEGGLGVEKAINAGGAIKTVDATASTSTTTGSGIFGGGIGVAGSAYANAVFANSKAVVVSTNATGGMLCSFSVTNTSAAQSITLPVPFRGATVPIGVAGWQEPVPVPTAGTNWDVSVICVSNSVTISSVYAPPGGAGTNISVIIHGVAP